MKKRKLLIFIGVAALAAAFFAFDLDHFLTLDYFKSQQSAIHDLHTANPLGTAALFFVAYVAATGLSLPGAALMTLVAGALFGLAWGTVIVSFASSLGATLAFLISRFVLRDWVQRNYGDKLKPINNGIEKDGAFYLFGLRLVIGFPFFVINLIMGLTPIRTWTFYWVSQLGMLAGTIVYVYAGTKVGEFRISAELIIALALLGFFPLIAKKALATLQARKVYAKWRKPARFDRNLIVIGAGSAGLVAAYTGAMVKAAVTLIEKERMGGDCLNTGCVPSKALIRSAKLLSQIKRAPEFGIQSASADFDFAGVMNRVQRVIRTVAPHDSVERYTRLGVECIEGEAKITSPWSVAVGGKTITTRAIVIAAGARPSIPPVPGLAEINPLTSDTVWSLRVLPARLVVLGGGPVGCELAQCFARFGSRVTQVEMLPRIMVREDPEISDMVVQRFRAEGVNVLVNHKAQQVMVDNGEKILVAENGGREIRIPFDELLCAVGRVANTAGYGLEELGIALTAAGTIETNDFMQTRYPNIYACGDVTGRYQFTHIAAHQAGYAAVNALFGGIKRFRVDYSWVPWCTFTEPEVARAGLNEQEARQQGVAHEVTKFGIDDLDRAIADEEAHGVVKVLTEPGKDRILGVTIVGAHAADIIAEFVLAMRHGLGLKKILATIHIYPTLAEANKYAAGVWRRAHKPDKLLEWVERYHAWMKA